MHTKPYSPVILTVIALLVALLLQLVGATPSLVYAGTPVEAYGQSRRIMFSRPSTDTLTMNVSTFNGNSSANEYDFSTQEAAETAPQLLTINPSRNAVTASLATTITVTYDQPMAAASVTSRTLVVHGMQSGMVTAVHGLINDNILVVTPTHSFHQGELVYVIATSTIASISGTSPLLASQWQFNAGVDNGRCMGGFSDVSAGLIGVVDGSAAWGDYNKDGNLDILLTGYSYSTGGVIARVYRNTGTGFSDIGAGLPGVDVSSTAWGDYDNDGDLDILLTGKDSYHNPISRLYRNRGNGFSPAFSPMGVSSGSVAWGDYDNDGNLDILLTGKDSGNYPRTKVYRNIGNGFSDIWATLPGVYDSSVAWGDYDNDGDLDILLMGRDDINSRLTRVYQNTGSGFSDIEAGLPDVANGSAAWGDYDNDGYLDILLTGTTASSTIAQVYRNTGSNFSHAYTLSGGISSSAAWGDYDNDGDLDILLAGYSMQQGSFARVYQNTGSGFSNIATGLPGVSGDSVAWGDYDNDGDLDVLLAGSTGTSALARVYQNEECESEIDIHGSGQPIANGSVAPSVFNGTDFGEALVNGGHVGHTFIISNSGTADLTLTGSSLISITGPAAADFRVTVQPGSLVASGDSTTFDITFYPSVPELRLATVSIANTDRDENPYSFTIQGMGTVPIIQFTRAAYQVNEDGTPLGATVTLTRTGNMEAASQVQVTFTDDTAVGGLDYAGSPINVFFPADDSDPQTVSMAITQDAIDETSEVLTMTIASVNNATIGAQSTASLEIVDDDNAGILVNPINGLFTTEAGGQDTFILVLTSEPTTTVVIPLSSDNTDEGTIFPSNVTFTAGNWATAQTITVTGVDDSPPVTDGNIGYNIITGAASSSDSNYNNLSSTFYRAMADKRLTSAGTRLSEGFLG